MDSVCGDEPLSKRRKCVPEVGSSSSSSAPVDPPLETGIGHEYDVFLSFCGRDTRVDFTDFLYTALESAGIRVFRDNERLNIGNEIGPELYQGIKQSTISIPIFSKNYASSKWCLKEFAYIMKCRKERKQVVLPVFYKVKPNQVQHQTGSYERAFLKHEENMDLDQETVKQWREALRQVGSLKGWEATKEANGHQGQLVKIIVTKVLRELKMAHLLVTDELVGIETRIEEVLGMIEVGVPDVRFTGICGMGGIGKTTLAKAIYNQISHQFDSCSYLEDIRETSKQGSTGLRQLQSQHVANLLKGDRRDFSSVDEGKNELSRRFREKRVLILLDDVDHFDHLNALAADPDWFAQGSRIIITTRNMDILNVLMDYKIYEVRELDRNQALQLFCKHAFRKKAPVDKLNKLLEEIVERTGGLPLALKVTGSFLCGKREEVWISTCEKLKVVPNGEVVQKLKISYDGLEPNQQEVFLDIACLFIGEDKTIVSYMWEDFFGYPPDAEIEVLLLTSLIKIGDDNKLRMHDQLRDLGREIVRLENLQELGKGRRLWSNEAVHALETHQGSKSTEAIHLNFGVGVDDYCFTSDQFRDLPNIRYLQLIGANISGDFHNLLQSMRWLRWQISSVDCNVMNLNLKNLIILDLSLSRLTNDWNAWNSIQVAAKKLRVLDLNLCIELTSTPVFTKLRKLERLSLRSCLNLRTVDPSIGKLKRLTSLNLECCREIKELPELGCVKSLKEFVIDGTSIENLPNLGNMKRLETLSAKNCRCLNNLPDWIGQLTSLCSLILDKTGISELTGTIGSLVNLRRLSLEDTPLKGLPMSIGGLKSLVELVLSKTKVAILPDSVGDLTNLEILKIDRSLVEYLPATIGKLERLELLDASGCPLSGDIPSELGKLSLLKVLLLRRTGIVGIPESIKGLCRLEILDVAWCTRLMVLPELPTSLISLSITCQSVIQKAKLPGLTSVKKLELIRSVVPEELVKLPKLEKLHIWRTIERFSFDEAYALSLLNELSIGNVPNITCLPKLPCGLQKLRISSCDSLERLTDLSNLQCLLELKIKRCPELQEIGGLYGLLSLRKFYVSRCGSIAKLDGLDKQKSLTSLKVSACANVKALPDLSELRAARRIKISCCKKLIEIQGIGSLDFLEDLDIHGSALERVYDLSDCKSLKWLRAINCKKLQGIDGLEELENLDFLDVSGCKMLQRLSMSGLKLMQRVFANDCEELEEIDGLDELESLSWLSINRCKSIKKLPNLSNLKYLEYLYAAGCEKLQGLDGLHKLEEIIRLDISGCKAIQHLPGLSRLRLLERLNAEGCESLRELEGVGYLEKLHELCISGCVALENLPDLSRMKELQWLDVSGCVKLKEIQGLDELELLKEIRIHGCESLQEFPDMPNVRIIRETVKDNDGDDLFAEEGSDEEEESHGAGSDDAGDTSSEESDETEDTSEEESDYSSSEEPADESSPRNSPDLDDPFNGVSSVISLLRGH